MSWVERYGIVGAYFIILISAFYFSFFGFTSNNIITYNQSSLALLVALFVTLPLPIGYIFISIGQWIYYCKWNIHPWQLERNAYNEFCKNNQIDIQIDNQIDAEVEVIKITRVFEKTDSKQAERIQSWLSKRNYVVAINFALIIATIVCWLIAIVVFKVWKSLHCNKYTWTVFISSFLLMIVLIFQSKSLYKIAKNVLKDYILEINSCAYKRKNNIKRINKLKKKK